ncbi:MAG: ferritin [Acidobacteria bacterium]|nr:ferritin [Acidobacteriota bacterium]
MASTEYHEPLELLSPETADMHRALVSAIEELEAIDWYQQRADACGDEDLKAILVHNKREEMEHFLMTLEWIRRKSPDMSEKMKRYLFTTLPITEIEEAEKAGAETGGAGGGDDSLGLGSLKEGNR